MCSRLLQALIIALLRLASSSAAAHHASAFYVPIESFSTSNRRRCTINIPKVTTSSSASSHLEMVRNIDLPEALVFYGLESMMEPIHDTDSYDKDADDFMVSCTLRPGIVRLLNECDEVGTAALLLCEEVDEECLTRTFQQSYERVSCSGDKWLQLRMSGGNDPAIHFRTFNSVLKSEVYDEYDDNLEFYKLGANGRSPSPAFILDSLRSVSIDPRGFGGSSGFARGQWIEPRRCPMPARTVVFIAGDWISPGMEPVIGEEGHKSLVKDRCTAARAAGCRIIYVEQSPQQTQQQRMTTIQDDMSTMALCDAVIDTFGNDNPRDLQSITLDAISTPGDYWLNPPSPRDDLGNSVSVDEIVELIRSKREASKSKSQDTSSNDASIEAVSEMSEDEIKAILADLDGI